MRNKQAQIPILDCIISVDTKLSIIDKSTNQIYNIFEVDGHKYVFVAPGEKVAIRLINRNKTSLMGYPCFVEGLNVYEGGPVSAENCTADSMWELGPGEEFDIFGVHNGEKTRKFVVTEKGFGISENKFKTDEYSGRICVYEKSQISKKTNLRSPTDFGNVSFRGGFNSIKDDEPYWNESIGLGVSTNTSVNANIGLGEEIEQPSYSTGVEYTYQTKELLICTLKLYTQCELATKIEKRYGSLKRFAVAGYPTLLPIEPLVPLPPLPHRR
ncbi:MAG: hypothetical protein ACRCXZ_03625 [Patescibacteria group bacterium]